MLKSIAVYLMSAVLLLTASSSLPQALSEFRDTEPGSLLFGVLHLAIATSAAVATVGLFKRSRWAARSIEVGGVAATILLASQPFFEPMSLDAQLAMFFGAAVVSCVAAGMAWLARRITKRAAESENTMQVLQPPPALLPDAQELAGPIMPPRANEYMARAPSAVTEPRKPKL